MTIKKILSWRNIGHPKAPSTYFVMKIISEHPRGMGRNNRHICTMNVHITTKPQPPCQLINPWTKETINEKIGPSNSRTSVHNRQLTAWRRGWSHSQVNRMPPHMPQDKNKKGAQPKMILNNTMMPSMGHRSKTLHGKNPQHVTMSHPRTWG